jgi:hypothetical protein
VFRKLFFFIYLACFLVLLLAGSAIAKTKHRPEPARSITPIDRDYVSALASANRFLYAWQAQDEENGVLMLTDEAKRHTTEDYLDLFFSPGVGAQQSYQMARGQKLAPGRYSFPVGLFLASGGSGIHARYSRIVVTKTLNGDWAVDRVP